MLDARNDWDIAMVREFLARTEPVPGEDVRAAAIGLVDAFLAGRSDIDAAIESLSSNWKLSRMAAEDRNILRLGVTELKQQQEPVAVIINEWIEVAKRFGGADSPGFVNGVLDTAAHA